MSHDHEAVQLAVASIDFELTPDERTRMDAGLAACSECQAIAASHLEIQRLLERLPVHDASPIVRQRVLRASLVPPRTRQWQLLLVAAALFGLLLAAGAAAIGAFRTDPLDPTSVIAPPSPTVLGGIISPEPSGSASPSSRTGDPPSPPLQGLPDPSAGEQLLLGYVPRDLVPACVRSRTAPSDAAIQGDVAGIDCPVSDDDVTESRYFLFGSAGEMQAWWESGMKEMNLQPDSGGCVRGREGETPFDGGRLQCFTATGGARLRWFDSEGLVYGVVISGTDDVRATVDWWTQSHAVSGVRPGPGFSDAEQTLVDEAPADIQSTCIPYRIVGTEATPVEGSAGAIDCLVESSLVIDVGYFRFPTVSALEAWWETRLPTLPVDAESGGCVGGRRGETGTAHGRIACYVTDGEARIRWTDSDALVYGALNGRRGDLGELVDWWNDRHDR